MSQLTINHSAQPVSSKLTPHEALELHEIVTSNIIAAKKLQASMALVRDPELKQLMEQALAQKKKTLGRYQDFYSSSLQQ